LRDVMISGCSSAEVMDDVPCPEKFVGREGSSAVTIPGVELS
jgi:hypothetical protein